MSWAIIGNQHPFFFIIHKENPRLLKTTGYLIRTNNKKIDILKDDKKWEEVEFFKSDYIASKDVNAWLGLYRVI